MEQKYSTMVDFKSNQSIVAHFATIYPEEDRMQMNLAIIVIVQSNQS